MTGRTCDEETMAIFRLFFQRLLTHGKGILEGAMLSINRKTQVLEAND
jgi:hypothetical protein